MSELLIATKCFKNREIFFNGDAFAAFAVVVAKARYHKHENVLPLIL